MMLSILALLLLKPYSGSAQYLWDLNIDPTESINFYDEDSYEDSKNALIERLAYWQTQLLADDDSDTVDDDRPLVNAYEKCGGVCPYVEDTYSLEIEQIYFPENPPHIIFVLVDDWGYNDMGYRSTYMNWTTPTIDKLAAEGIFLNNYFTHDFCVPSRAALMTGRFPGRMGLLNDLSGKAALPLNEVTMAQELKSAGYETHMVGKWDLGSASVSRLPTYRGFDSFYGYFLGFIDYYTKYSAEYLDLHDDVKLVTDQSELSDTYHSAFLFQSKVEAVIEDYADSNSSSPLFLYYSLQLVHSPYEAPAAYTERCADIAATSMSEDDYTYCGMNVMLDEVIANLTCALEENGILDDNFVFILASDNGGSDYITGNSVPFRGHKYDLNRGGISANAFITSNLIPKPIRGTTYSGQMHVSDWMPTIMSLVTNGEWAGGYTGNTIDGVHMWGAITNNSTSPRTEIVHYAGTLGEGSLQIDMVKLDVDVTPSAFDNVTYYFPSDLASGDARSVCDSPKLVPTDDDSATDDVVTGGDTHAPTEEAAREEMEDKKVKVGKKKVKKQKGKEEEDDISVGVSVSQGRDGVRTLTTTGAAVEIERARTSTAEALGPARAISGSQEAHQYDLTSSIPRSASPASVGHQQQRQLSTASSWFGLAMGVDQVEEIEGAQIAAAAVGHSFVWTWPAAMLCTVAGVVVAVAAGASYGRAVGPSRQGQALAGASLGLEQKYGGDCCEGESPS